MDDANCASCALEDDYTGENRGCPEAIEALTALDGQFNADAMTCSLCPFPFCIHAEAKRLKRALVVERVKLVQKMNCSLSEAALRLNVSLRTMQRAMQYTSPSCYWCMIDKATDGIFCRSESFTVARDNGSIVVALAAHRKAAPHEAVSVKYLVGSLFPLGVLEEDSNAQVGANEHEHWTITNVSKGEANRVYDRMTELNKYAMCLR